jgi:hypothetical protein
MWRQVEFSATSWSLIQRNPTDCVVSECDLETSWMRKPWPTHWEGGGLSHQQQNKHNQTKGDLCRYYSEFRHFLILRVRILHKLVVCGFTFRSVVLQSIVMQLITLTFWEIWWSLVISTVPKQTFYMYYIHLSADRVLSSVTIIKVNVVPTSQLDL